MQEEWHSRHPTRRGDGCDDAICRAFEGNQKGTAKLMEGRRCATRLAMVNVVAELGVAPGRRVRLIAACMT